MLRFIKERKGGRELELELELECVVRVGIPIGRHMEWKEDKR